MSLKLGDFLSLNTQKIAIDDAEEYKISGVQSYGKGVVIRRAVFGKELNMKQYQVIKENQLMWCKVDTKSGAFGVTKDAHVGTLASTNMALANIDTTKVLPDFLESIFRIKHFHESITKASFGSTNRKYLTPKQLFENIAVPKLSIEKQKLFLKKIASLENSELNCEISNQQTYLTKLRQAILQEAIEGKLTADWRVNNPVEKGNPDFDAVALLAKIKAEKQKLITDGKTKKEKPLAPIKADDVPFALPDGWVWVRLGEIAESSLGKMLDKAKNQGEYQKYLRNLNVRWFDFNLTDLLEMRFKENENVQYTAIKGDVLICEGGYPGRAAIWENEEPIYFQKAIHRVRFHTSNTNKWFLYVLFLSDLTREIEKYFTGSGIQHFTGKELKRFVIPLPPLAEQYAIVERVDRLLASVNALEQQVQERKTYAEQLMQAVLKEAFAG